MYRLISLSECIKTLCLILKTICCKKVDYFSKMFRKYKLKEPKMAAKNFLRQQKLSVENSMHISNYFCIMRAQCLCNAETIPKDVVSEVEVFLHYDCILNKQKHKNKK